jgi:hypothetical protein
MTQMNRIERSVLSPVVRLVCKFNRNVWWELKRQIWDLGFQTYYPWQDDYFEPARKAMARLDETSLAVLTEECMKRSPKQDFTPDQVRDYYANLVVEEVVKRATVAAYRTVEW